MPARLILKKSDKSEFWITNGLAAMLLALAALGLSETQPTLFRRGLEVLAILAALIAIPVWVRVRRRHKEMEDLLLRVIEAQREVGTVALEESAVMAQAMSQAMRLTGGGGAVVEFVEGDEMVYKYAVGSAANSIGMRLSRKGSFSGLCVDLGKPLLCVDSETDERVDRQACRRVKVRSMIVTPLYYEGRVTAVIKVFSGAPGTFSEREVATLQLVAGILASSMGRAAAQRQIVVARDKAEAATKIKSQFLANMSHEIRTPLNGILGLSRLLLGTPLDSEQKGLAEDVHHAGETLLRLVNDILDFSKIEAGKMEFESLDFELNLLLHELSRIFRLVCSEKHLDFSVSCDSPEAWLRGDPGRLRQILINLVDNAIKFTSKGHVRIQLSHESESDTHFRLRFAVEDSGIGLSPTVSANLFTEFNQADVSTTRRFGGTGLGLAISKHLAEKMGGQIGVRSEEGKGSTFWFTVELPRGTARLAGEGIATNVTIDLHQRAWQALVVDDNRINRLVAEKSLKVLGLTVETRGARAHARVSL